MADEVDQASDKEMANAEMAINAAKIAAGQPETMATGECLATSCRMALDGAAMSAGTLGRQSRMQKREMAVVLSRRGWARHGGARRG